MICALRDWKGKKFLSMKRSNLFWFLMVTIIWFTFALTFVSLFSFAWYKEVNYWMGVVIYSLSLLFVFSILVLWLRIMKELLDSNKLQLD